MRRREFIRTALVSGAAGSMAKLVYSSSGQPKSAGTPARVPGRSKIGYIREHIPAFEIPPYRGESYEDNVPDTHDLAERAALAVNDLTSQTDPTNDYDIYWISTFYQNPPVLEHQGCDALVQPKWEESLPLMRTISGSDQNTQVDRIWTEGVLKSIGPDGLYYVATEGRPWVRPTIGWWRPSVVMPDGTMAKPKDAPLDQFTEQLLSGRIIMALTLYYLRDKNPMWKQTIERMIDRWAELAIDKGDYCYYPAGLLLPNSKIDPRAEMPIGMVAGEHSHRLIQGLAQYYRVSGYEPARTLAKKLGVYVQHRSKSYDPRGRFIDRDPNIALGHFHTHAIGLVSLIEYALAVGDREMAEFVKSSYEWAKTDAYGCALTGFFPEFVPASAPPIGQKAIAPYRVCEPCCIADMVALALKLTDAGVGDYWDDVDRWVRNEFAVAQMMETDWIYRVAQMFPPVPVEYNESADHVAARTLGAFIGYTTGNDYGIEYGAYGQPGVKPTGIAGCCVGNGTRSIYYVWQRMLDYHDGQARVHLLLNRASHWADVHSYIPYKGRVDLKIKKPCQSVLVRVPEWIESRSPLVASTLNGARQPFTWEGRYVKLGPAAAGDTMSVTFPISERTERNVNMGGTNYTVVLKGNTVISIDPPGKFYPLYERKQYRANRAPMHKVKRFVPEQEIQW